MRPRIICHMLTSINGKITGEYMETESAEIVGSEYERINKSYNSQAWLCGRVTTDENFTFYHKPNLDENAPQVPDGDFVAVSDAPMYYVSVDASGKIGWKSNELSYEDRPKAHVIEVLTEKVSNSYKAFLREMKISYLIVGKEKLDCDLLVKKLYDLFDIKTLMISGGGYINGSFLNAGLIDEISLLIAPVTDSYSNSVSLFEYGDYLTKKAPVEFKLEAVEKLKGDGIWLHYVIKK